MSVVTPTLTTCDLCNQKMAALPGPMRRVGRPEPPPGFEKGYIVEQAERIFPICQPCLIHVIELDQGDPDAKTA